MSGRLNSSGGIAWREWGDGPALVALHGIGSASAGFAGVARHLPDRRLIAWDMPGYGDSGDLERLAVNRTHPPVAHSDTGMRPFGRSLERMAFAVSPPSAGAFAPTRAGARSCVGARSESDWTRDAPGIDWPDAGDYAAVLLTLFEAAGIERAVVLGHSLGCLIAGRFAREHPGRVARLILASPALGHRTRPPELSAAASARLADFERLGPAEFAALRAPRLLSRPDSAALEAVRAQMAALRPAGHLAATRLLSAGELIADAARLRVRTDVIVGAEDGITPPETARRLYRSLPDAARGAFHDIPGAGHALAAEAPKAFAACLMQLEET
ncbi:MAG: alpha/beta fold hydrolase [Alphaproteobacteria bacterium]|nr:MAG: alpha/beta fold hydrolase [Alphaproteobacteria bacterium]